LQGLATAVTVVMLFAAPAVASASPQWFINGRLAEAKHEGVLSYGTLTLENNVLGKISCQTIMSGAIYNQSEQGLGPTEGFETYDCVTEPTPCPGSFISGERPVAVKETERTYKPVYVKGDLPWPAELIEKEGSEKQRTLRINGPWLTVVLLCENLEVPFEGRLEPIFVNGIGNGMTPSHLQFQGKRSKTGVLETTKLPRESEDNIAYVTGELANVGGNMELITAE
jgi:hypothetical protein